MFSHRHSHRQSRPGSDTWLSVDRALAPENASFCWDSFSTHFWALESAATRKTSCGRWLTTTRASRPRRYTKLKTLRALSEIFKGKTIYEVEDLKSAELASATETEVNSARPATGIEVEVKSPKT